MDAAATVDGVDVVDLGNDCVEILALLVKKSHNFGGVEVLPGVKMRCQGCWNVALEHISSKEFLHFLDDDLSLGVGDLGVMGSRSSKLEVAPYKVHVHCT